MAAFWRIGISLVRGVYHEIFLSPRICTQKPKNIGEMVVRCSIPVPWVLPWGRGANFFPTEWVDFFAVCELLNFASLEKTRTQVQRRNCALPVRFCLVQLCQSELSRSATSSTGEKGHFLFLNRNIVNPAKKKTKQPVCGFWCFSWVQNARKRSFRFGKLELPVSIFSHQKQNVQNIGPL